MRLRAQMSFEGDKSSQTELHGVVNRFDDRLSFGDLLVTCQRPMLPMLFFLHAGGVGWEKN